MSHSPDSEVTVVSCLLDKEDQILNVADALKASGLYDRYEETVYGERVLISIQTMNFQERDIVRSVLADAGVTEFFYREGNAA